MANCLGSTSSPSSLLGEFLDGDSAALVVVLEAAFVDDIGGFLADLGDDVVGAEVVGSGFEVGDVGKISKKNGRDPSKEVQWSSVMDDALVDAFLHQVIIGGRVNGTFTSKAYDDIVKELEINKDKVKNRQKTLKKNFHECYDIFKDELSGFRWNNSLNMWTAEPKV
ncbi:hypothetical protein SO802_018511 [Lithocarpus litseifolius]|uniref:Myb/SANT-like domain-containing protein n=1 Tax=Lithocarpus litseifolius TaxID=425828 RepID=A0AAW2CM78_9ROSI